MIPRLMGPGRAPGVEALGWATLIRSVGSGGVLTLSVLYFATYRLIPAEQVGVALTIGGLAGVAASVPLGHLANGARSRDVASASIAAQGLVTLGFLAVTSFPVLIGAACLSSVAESGSNGARGALVAGLVVGKDRVPVRARLRAITNAGSAAGAGLGGLVLGARSAVWWDGSIVACAVCLLVGGGLIMAVPRPATVPAPPGAPRWLVLRDRPYAVLALLNVVLTMNLGLLTVALPIWIATRVQAPTGLFGALVVLNTVLVVLFQVRASRGIDDVRSGARAVRTSGILLGLCCLLFAAAGLVPTAVAITVLVLGGVAHAVGEMVYAAGSWELSYDLAPDHAHGQYQGMFQMSSSLGNAIAPALTVGLVANLGGAGWVVLGVLMTAAGAAAVPAYLRHAPTADRPASAA